ncbi:MAG TPA: hypothetical protein VLM40_09035, partial [Gemmata sp.]|nr:hypothetical protein [Gemmata sp.]
MRFCHAVAALFAAAIAGSLTRAGDDPPRPDVVVLTGADGKETRLTDSKLTTGTRRLRWLADPKASTADAKLGPLAMEVREPNSTTLAKGVITLVPIASIESVTYDYDKLSASVRVKGIKDPLLGTLQYARINTLGI